MFDSSAGGTKTVVEVTDSRSSDNLAASMIPVSEGAYSANHGPLTEDYPPLGGYDCRNGDQTCPAKPFWAGTDVILTAARVVLLAVLCLTGALCKKILWSARAQSCIFVKELLSM